MILGIKITVPSYKRPISGSTPPPPTNLILLENGAHIADPEIYADKFCDEYKDVADPRLQKLLLKQLDRFMEEEEARATFDDDNDDDDVLMDKTKLDLNFKQDEDGGIIDSLSDVGVYMLNHPATPNKDPSKPKTRVLQTHAIISHMPPVMKQHHVAFIQKRYIAKTGKSSH